MEENLIKMEKFFKLNLKIKELIIKMKPPKLNYGEEYYIEYVSNIFSDLEKIREIFYYFIEYLNMDISVKNIIDTKFDDYIERFINCNYDYYKLQDEYEGLIFSLTIGLEKVINDKFYGYANLRFENEVFSKCNTINDMLHAFHSFLVNNENFYNQIPAVKSKIVNEEYGDTIRLCGRKNKFAYDLYDNFPKNVVSSRVDILSFEHMILIMVRDLGHALSIEINEENDNLRVKYFIPKVCNVDKVNKLKGVDKLDLETSNMFSVTKGEFVVNKNNFINEMIEFLESVPTDSDVTDMQIRFN